MHSSLTIYHNAITNLRYRVEKLLLLPIVDSEGDAESKEKHQNEDHGCSQSSSYSNPQLITVAQSSRLSS